MLKTRDILIKALFGLMGAGLAYLLVYTLTYLPNGYELVSKQQGVLHIQEYNLVGLKEDKIKWQPPSEEEDWRLKALKTKIPNLMVSYFILFTSIFITLFLTLYESSKGKRIIGDLIASGLTVLFAFLTLLRNLDRIKELL
ncbi:hypothetical protein [Pontibacillus yanchengensis]|nr:hypothetical protein [Pontibacillus yanchengensis]